MSDYLTFSVDEDSQEFDNIPVDLPDVEETQIWDEIGETVSTSLY